MQMLTRVFSGCYAVKTAEISDETGIISESRAVAGICGGLSLPQKFSGGFHAAADYVFLRRHDQRVPEHPLHCGLADSELTCKIRYLQRFCQITSDIEKYLPQQLGHFSAFLFRV